MQKQPPGVFCKRSVLKNFANFTGKYLYWNLFLINLFKRDSNTDVPCEIFEIFKNTYSEEHLRVAASEYTEDTSDWSLRVC